MEILYEDNHLLVCYKPKGILSQSNGTDTPDMLTILKNYIKEKYNKPGDVYLGLVHRLDINTSGVMVFAKTSKAAMRLSKDIQNHNFEKRYIAKVEGKLTNKKGVLVNFLSKDEKNHVAFENYSGLEAKLEYKVIEEGSDFSIVDINLLTGRFHQIRCQFSLLGNPLYGDVKYGSKHKIDYLEFPLDAYYLAFNHPTLKTRMEFNHNILKRR